MTSFTIMDAGHGSCCYLIASNGNLMMFDCGHKNDPEIRPSSELLLKEQTSVELLVITNYDEDHISDIINLRKVGVKRLQINQSITPEQLRDLKIQESGEISSAMETLLDMMTEYSAPAAIPASEFPDVSIKHFYNSHPFGNGNDTNNISVVTILDAHGVIFLIPGDIEKEGWEQLLQSKPDLCARLCDVNVYIASHHGRKNGYCEDIFTKYNCRPNVFVFSDDSIKYSTQESHGLYQQWAQGMKYNNEDRKILTTRKDGEINWNW